MGGLLGDTYGLGLFIQRVLRSAFQKGLKPVHSKGFVFCLNGRSKPVSGAFPVDHGCSNVLAAITGLLLVLIFREL